MKEYLYNYIEALENDLKSKNKEKGKMESIKIKIEFFQHERLIHLIVTCLYTLIFLIFMGLISISFIFVIPTIMLLVFLLFYIVHYFRLENGVQYLYKLYDKFDKM